LLKIQYNIGNYDRRPTNVDVNTTKTAAGMSLRSDAPISPRDATKAISWLKKNFEKQIAAAVEGTHYSVDHICGIACQETAYFWLRLPNTTRKAFPCDTKAFRKEYGDERTEALIEEANKTRGCGVIVGRTGYIKDTASSNMICSSSESIRISFLRSNGTASMHAWKEPCASFVAHRRDMAVSSRQFGPTTVRDPELRSMPKT
jgi:hypothetical protein